MRPIDLREPPPREGVRHGRRAERERSVLVVLDPVLNDGGEVLIPRHVEGVGAPEGAKGAVTSATGPAIGVPVGSP